MIEWLGLASTTWLSTTGAIWDVIGAVILSRGYLWATDENIRKEKAAAFGANPSAARAAAEERYNQRAGLSIIIAGFFFQAASSFGIAISWEVAGVMLFGLALVVVVYLWNFQYQTVRAGLRISFQPGVYERVWRDAHNDVPQLVWDTIIWNEGYLFGTEPKPTGSN